MHGRRYHASSYDDHFCLKPPAMLWLAVLYLSRGITVPFLLQISSLAGSSADTTSVIRGAFSTYTLFPSLIAAVVLFALIRRAPSGSQVIRWIWAHGRVFLSASAMLDVVLSVIDLRTAQGTGGALRLLTATFDLYCLLYINAARRARDSFSAFPAPLDGASA